MRFTDYLRYIPDKEPVVGIPMVAGLLLGGFVALTGNLFGWTFGEDELLLMGGIALTVATIVARQFAWSPASVRDLTEDAE